VGSAFASGLKNQYGFVQKLHTMKFIFYIHHCGLLILFILLIWFQWIIQTSPDILIYLHLLLFVMLSVIDYVIGYVIRYLNGSIKN